MRIALVHLCSFGDCLYATLVARQIKRDYPGSHLTWVIGDKYASIILENPEVDSIHEVPVSGFNEALGTGWLQARAWVEEQMKCQAIDRAFYTQILPDNFLLYDGLIRSNVYRSYGSPVEGSHQPVVVVTRDEIDRVEKFINQHHVKIFRHVLLFECGPRSGQSPMNPVRAEELAHRLAARHSDLVLLLTSDRLLQNETSQVIDASHLSFRENAPLSRHCTGLIGCSSGITWLTTSTAGKSLPMLQILTKSTDPFRFASVAADFDRFFLDSSEIIEMAEPSDDRIIDCVDRWLFNSHIVAKQQFHESLRLTSEHALNAFKAARARAGRIVSLKNLQHFLAVNDLPFPWGIIPNEILATMRDISSTTRSTIRMCLQKLRLLPLIRTLVGRDPEDSRPTR